MKLKLKLRAWLMICMVAVLCLDFVADGTLAWFTDRVEVTENVVTAGNLDAEFKWADGKLSPDAAVWQDASAGTMFDYEKWEPGYVAVRHLHVDNVGRLAFQYQLGMAASNDVSALADVIDVYLLTPARKLTGRQELAGLSPVGTLRQALQGLSLNGSESYLLPGQGATVTVALKMREEAGNEYQNLLLGSDLAVQLRATQYAYEEDSFGKDYDEDAVFPAFNGRFAATADVTGKVSGNRLTEDVTIGSPAAGMYAIVPEGTLLKPGTTKLVLTVDTTTRSDEIEMTMGQVSRSLDVHIDGIAKNNTVAATIHLGPVMPIGYKAANIQLYHVENDTPKKMKAVDTLTGHNQFIYDAETGNTVVMMATFSEVTAVVAADDPWTGARDYSWYNTTDKEFTLTTEEQFAGFAAIVGGMAEGIKQDDFSGKTVKLGADLYLGGKSGRVWYPVGYYNNKGSYDKVSGGSVSSDVSSFEGTFDGQNHTISDIYQDTWEMFGDYNSGYSGTPNHYKDGMGIFGVVYNGTIKNLTVDNFQSDGEFCTTGCVAAYAAGKSTFENINIYNSNPRAYNVPNGGVVGYAYDEEGATNVINFNNVEVHSSTKITALWGSWDVGCGGILGRVNGDTTVSMTDCTVAAVIDVFNDVCGNYQYYQYRYSGMLIGTVGDDGDPTTGPEKVNFSNVKVYIGNWADYYFCEFEKNSQGSYTDDFQFSRVEKSEIIYDDSTNMPKGCTHEHTANEDKLAVYLPFSQIYTGYGWGANPVYGANGVTVYPAFYTVTYMDATGENVLAVDYVTKGERSDTKLWANEYTVKEKSITEPGVVEGSTNKQTFRGWVNASSSVMETIREGNRNNIVLYESWDNPYTVRFLDQFGNVIRSVSITQGKTSVEASLIPAIPDVDDVAEDFEGKWDPDPKNLQNVTSDITIRPIYVYNGNLNLVPVDEAPQDGIIDYYRVEAAKNLSGHINIPGHVNGVPVKTIERMSQGLWGSVTSIKVNKGTEELKAGSLAGTIRLDTVELPSTLTKIEKNAFCTDILSVDFKAVTIIFNGTKAEWDAIEKEDKWDSGLTNHFSSFLGGWNGAKIEFSDGTVYEKYGDGDWRQVK